VAVEVNSPDPPELDREAAFASSAFREAPAVGEDEAVDEEAAPASACSGPNSRLALAAAGSDDSLTSSRVELEEPARACVLSSEIGWVFASEELRAARDTGASAP